MSQKSSIPLQRREIEPQSLKVNTEVSGLMKQRGIKLQPIITTFKNDMPKQQVWRCKDGLMSANTYPDTNIPDVSRWRSSSSERTAEDGTNNTTNEDEYNSKKKPELSYDPAETLEKRLERLKKFYSEKPRECYLDKDDNKEYLGNLLFDRLYHEVQYTVFETGPSKHRGQEHVRFFWDDVRRQLRDDEEPALEWPPAKEVQHCMASIHDGNSVRDVRPCEEQQSR